MSDREYKESSKRVETDVQPARRNILVGTGAFLVGGIAGHASAQQPASAQESAATAPPLPWEWSKIDPMEAGSRTYNAYLKQGG